MGKYIKVTFRDDGKLNSYRLHLKELNKFLSNFDNLFNLDISSELSEKHIPMDEYEKSNAVPLTPENSGYIFIDRSCNKLFYFNNLKRLSKFGFHEFTSSALTRDSNFLSDGVGESEIKLNVDTNSDQLDSFLSMIPFISYLDIPSLELRIEPDGMTAIELYSKVLEVKPKTFLTGLDFDFDESIVAVFNNWTVYEGTGTMLSLFPLFEHLKINRLVDCKDIKTWYTEKSTLEVR
ncbi:conserved hypothetical protein [Vibrio chagasii]|nr:conserved hypothetical protein [Vibrio chagasii]CAH6958827.1 conserved hypothetical protein [Vibrio chagasii]